MVRRQRIPAYPLTDYAPPAIAEVGVYVTPFEKSIGQRPSRLHLHRHEYFEFFLLEGKGGYFHDFQDYNLTGTSVVTVEPGEVHAWPGSEKLRGTMIAFTRDFLDGQPFPAPSISSATSLGGGGYVISLPIEQVGLFENLMRQAHSEFCRRKKNWVGILRDCLRLLLALSTRLQPLRSTENLQSGRSSEIAQRFRLLVEENFAVTRSVGDYAQRLGITAGYLNTMLQVAGSPTAGTAIRERVLLEARRWLLHSELNVSEIAHCLGFDDPSYFARYFRGGTGSSPAEFRQSIRAKYRIIGG